MNDIDHPRPAAGAGGAGVTLGYLTAAAVLAALWVGVGVVLIPVIAVLAIPHGLATGGADPVIAGHHRWLMRHHLWSAATLLLVLIAPLLAIPTLLDTTMTVLNTMAYAPHPMETLAAAWPELGIGTLMLAAFVAIAGWLIVTLWLSVRLIRRWLRWMDRAPA
ncbi:hypothetical protein SAOR_14215 [Salinisphaera orenii MK-B5]|uniref:Uncharacterized protein n=2 Tax=Salinisphaera orenii TaxID=856731 RepID=A0A423PGL1_9GAMM|nr:MULTISPECIES: hypothetical protein [Salinisphaera]ROO24752.1 hypothetical protein SAOR_14215 [Salinisphaera orenii MK-B5]ROO26074.1 hypothetical protein SAHL_13245 [Salinisphaera halophila YIM 95161]